MSMRTIARSSSNRNSASALASSVLPTPVGPRNRNEPVGRFGVGDAGAGPAHRVGHRLHRGLLADDAGTELVLHAQQLGGLALEQPAGGDAGPRATTSAMSSAVTSSLTRRVLRPGPAAAPASASSFSSAGISPYSSRDAVSKSPSRWARSIWPCRSSSRSFSSPTRLSPAFSAPSGRSARRAARSGRPARRAAWPAARRTSSVSFSSASSSIFEPVDGALQLVDLDRAGVDLHAQPRGRLVDQVDRLVGQEARGDVAVGQRRGGDQRGVGDLRPCGAPRSAP